jgi:hypothetical protein
MEGIWKKMNLKPGTEVMILQSPAEFHPYLEEIKKLTNVYTDLEAKENIAFCIIFTTRQAEVNQFAELVASRLEADGALWFCYPKGSSRKYTCDFNRDTGWEILGKLGFEPVRQIAIDNDWSALRFRRVEYIKTLTRSFAMTEAGKMRTKN